MNALNARIHALNVEHDTLNQAWWDMPSILSPEAKAVETRLLEIDGELAELELHRKALRLRWRRRWHDTEQ